MKTQRQRAYERKRDDYRDAVACAERAGDRCEVCGCHAPYPYGSLHHVFKKRTMEDRRNRDWHVWLCGQCHHDAHEYNPERINAACEAIIRERI